MLNEFVVISILEVLIGGNDFLTVASA